MTETVPASLHIHAPVTTYLPRVRYPGWRTYKLLTRRPIKSKLRACRMLADEMATGRYKRGDVLGYQEWYEPFVIVEMVRR